MSKDTEHPALYTGEFCGCVEWVREPALDLVVVADLVENFDRVVGLRVLDARDVELAVRDLFHLLFDLRQIVGRDGRRAVDVVIESVFDHRTDRNSRTRIELFHRVGEEVRHQGGRDGLPAHRLAFFVQLDQAVPGIEVLGGQGKGAAFVGDAVMGYTKAIADIALLKQLGVDSYRFSMEWARIEPKQGTIDETALQHYSDLLDALKAAVRAVNPRLAEFEASCFDGKYITGDITADYLSQLAVHRDELRGVDEADLLEEEKAEG